MMRMSPSQFFCFTVLIFMLPFPPAATGQEAQRATSDLASEASGLAINGTCFHDLDSSGFRSINEPGLEGRTVSLMQNGTELANTTSDAEGGYIFRNLRQGTYELKEVTPKGWKQTAPGGGSYRVRLTDRSASNLDFGGVGESRDTSARAVRQYPIMHPSQEDVRRWAGQYNSAPQAALSPQIASMLASAPGASYSLLDQLDYNPAERDQGSCGNCWAWAGTGVMEIDLARQNGIKDRLSLQYLDSNYHGGCGGSGACCGGWLENLAGFYRGTGKAIPWSNANAQYVDGSVSCGSCAKVPAGTISMNPSYPITSIAVTSIPTQAASKEAAIQNIKNVLRQGKAVWFGYFLPSSSAWSNFISFWNTRSESTVWQPDAYCGQPYSYGGGGGHAVLCVGYDDTDPNNRYWIMLNSWGDTTLRPHGLFRVNMDMNYGCGYGNMGAVFYWMTLDMSYPNNENSPPETPSTPLGPTTGRMRNTYSYSTSAKDPDGDDVKCIFDWGDKTQTETVFVRSETSANASHTWQKAGTFYVKAKATDDKADSPWSGTLAVRISSTANASPKAPSTPAGTTRGTAGKAYTYTSFAGDPNGGQVKYTFDWGDKTRSETAYKGSGKSVRVSHVWSSAGTYRIRVMATDTDGAVSPWSAYLTVRISGAGLGQQANPAETQAGKAKACPCLSGKWS